VASLIERMDLFQKNTLLWWLIPGALAGMPMPFIHSGRRVNRGGALNAYPDELPDLYAAGIRAVVSLLNIPSDAPVYESAGFAYLCVPLPDGGAPTMAQASEFVRFVTEQSKRDGRLRFIVKLGLAEPAPCWRLILSRRAKQRRRPFARFDRWKVPRLKRRGRSSFCTNSQT
jgi:hypothetical protein